MVKTTYALTLFAAVSLAAPVQQLNGRATNEGSSEHKNLIENIPIIGSMLGEKHDKRSTEKPQHHNMIDGLPIVGDLIGNDKQTQRRDVGGGGISGLPLVGGLFGKHEHAGGNNGVHQRRGFGQNYGQNEGQNEDQNAAQHCEQNHAQNGKRDIKNSLSGLPIVGGLFKDQEKPSHKQTETPAKHINTRQSAGNAGHSKGVFGIIQSLTSGQPVTKSHKRDEGFGQFEPMSDVVDGAVASGMDAESSAMSVRRDEPAAPQDNKGQQGNEKGSKDQKGKDSKDSNNLFDELMGPEGLGSLKGNAHHGIGLFPMRRDTNELEARQAPPIQGSTLTDVVFQGGVFKKVNKLLAPGAPEKKPGQSDPADMSDGSTAGPPSPESGAGPHSGPGLAAEKQQQAKDSQKAKESQ